MKTNLVTPLLALFLSVVAPPHAWGQVMDWSEYDASVGIYLQKPGLETVCSGILLTPTVVLTAGHCVKDLEGAEVVMGATMKGAVSHRLPVESWLLHPGYRGNVPGESTDIGLMYLGAAAPADVPFPEITSFKSDRPFERIGYGLRDGANVRTMLQSTFKSFLPKGYIVVNDAYGFPGDSGGPVYQRIGGGLRLVGVHTGRKILGRRLVDQSYVQLLTARERTWIEEKSSRLQMAQ